jgi:hypothetical protein
MFPETHLISTSKGIITLQELTIEHPPYLEMFKIKQDYYDYNKQKRIHSTIRYGFQKVYTYKLDYGFEYDTTEQLLLNSIVQLPQNKYENANSIEFIYKLSNCPSNMSTNLAWLIGLIMSSNFERINTLTRQKIATIINNYTGCDARIDSNFNLVTTPELLKYIIAISQWTLKNGIDMFDPSIPKFVRWSSKNTIIAYLAGLFNNNCTIVVSNESFAKQIQEVAYTCGIFIQRSLDSNGNQTLFIISKMSNKNSVDLFNIHSTDTNITLESHNSNISEFQFHIKEKNFNGIKECFSYEYSD